MPPFDHLLPLVATAALTACAATGPPAQIARPVSGPTAGGERLAEEAVRAEGCSVKVMFGSFATGPDTKAMQVVSRLLAADPDVTQVTRSAYGREGEHSLCIDTTDRGAATRLFDALESAISWDVAAPVTIIGPNGRVAVASGRKAQNRR